MFENDVKTWLEGNTSAGYQSYVADHRAETAAILDRLAIEPESELAQLYLYYGAGAVRGWYELSEIDDIPLCTRYAHEELEIPANYIALSGVEGQGIVLYDRITQAVYDVEFGQFEQLADGSLDPIADTVGDFLRWCKARSQAA